MARTMVSSVDMNSTWCQVRNTYFIGVTRSRASDTANPRIMIQATLPPNCSWAMPMIASLVGTTPCAPVAPVIMAPSGSRKAVTSPAPTLMNRKSSVALMAPPHDLPGTLVHGGQAHGGDDADEERGDGQHHVDEEVCNGEKKIHEGVVS